MKRPVPAPRRPRPSRSMNIPPEAQAHGRTAAKNAPPDLSSDRHYAVLIAERRRMRKHVKNMNATVTQHKEFVDLLRALLSDEAFVRLLAEQGFTTMPRVLMEHLGGTVSTRADAVANLGKEKGVDNGLDVLPSRPPPFSQVTNCRQWPSPPYVQCHRAGRLK
jgi:hypothetical protein